MEMYGSRLEEMTAEKGDFTAMDATAVFARHLQAIHTDNMQELTYLDKQRVHNLKYFTWVEQQGKTYEEIQAQWYDRDYWTGISGHIDELDALIDDFNDRVGLLAKLLDE